MAFVRDLFERLRHSGVDPRGSATLSEAVSELWQHEEESKERERLEQARPRFSITKRAQPKAASSDEAPPAEGEATRRWVPRSF